MGWILGTPKAKSEDDVCPFALTVNLTDVKKMLLLSLFIIVHEVLLVLVLLCVIITDT
jgi:hypothetical protein